MDELEYQPNSKALDEINAKALEFKHAMQRISKTRDGKIMLQALKETFLDSSSLGKDPHITYYNLGRSDLVKFLFDSIS